MKVRYVLVLGMALTTWVAGCETMTHEDEGAIIGGVIGGVVGSQVGDGSGRTIATILGAVAGSMIGRHIGRSMDDTDRMRTAQTLHENRTGFGRSWTNPDTGNRFNVTPTRTFERAGAPCREFTLQARVGNQEDEDVHGTACMRSDGHWEIVGG